MSTAGPIRPPLCARAAERRFMAICLLVGLLASALGLARAAPEAYVHRGWNVYWAAPTASTDQWHLYSVTAEVAAEAATVRGWHAIGSDCIVGSGSGVDSVVVARRVVECGELEYVAQVPRAVDPSFVQDLGVGSTRIVGEVGDFRFDLVFSAGTTGPHVGVGYRISCGDGKPVGAISVPGPPQDVRGEAWSVPVGEMYEAVTWAGPTACVHQ